MPIYEYICQGCGRRFECFILNRNNQQEVSCSHCGSGDIQRILSTFGLGGGKTSTGTSVDGCRTCSTKTCSTCR